MKKLITPLLLSIFCASANAQFAMDFSIASRLEVSPQFGYSGNGNSLSFGNSSLYTNLEASFGEHVTLVWVGHWLDSGGLTDKGYIFPYSNTPTLYSIYESDYPCEDGNKRTAANFWRSDRNNFTDFLYLEFSAGDWAFRAGKDVLALASFENEPYDWEWNYNMVSTFWMSLPSYQWGGLIQWNIPESGTTLTAQAVSSPFAGAMSRPWKDGCGMYTFLLNGEYGPVTIASSISAARTTYYADLGKNRSTIGLGAFNIKGALTDRLSLSAEWNMRWDAMKQNSQKVLGSIDFAPSDRVELQLRGGWEKIGTAFETDNWGIDKYWFVGTSVGWYPIKNSRDLRLHAVVGTDKYSKSVNVSAGFLYNHTFHVK